MTYKTIPARELLDRRNRGEALDVIDVRTPAEFEETHVEFARNVPLDRLDPKTLMQSRPNGANGPLFVLCRSGGRAKQACQQFYQSGFDNVVSVEGGTLACIDAGLPIVRGKKTISLERQVRIAAGLLVLLGVVFGWFVHLAFFGLSAFVGVGLVFAGITDTCGMGMLLARMPWNQTRPKVMSVCNR